MKKIPIITVLLTSLFSNATEPLLKLDPGPWSEEIEGTCHWLICNVNHHPATVINGHQFIPTQPAISINALPNSPTWTVRMEGSNKSIELSSHLIKKALGWGKHGIEFLQYKINLANCSGLVDAAITKVGHYPCCTLLGGVLGGSIGYSLTENRIKTSYPKLNHVCVTTATVTGAMLGIWLLVNLADKTPLAYLPAIDG